MWSQSLFQNQNLELESGKLVYPISNLPIINHSETIWADTLLLVAGMDYTLDYQKGFLTILVPPDTPLLKVEFIQIPKHLTESVQRYSYQARSDSLYNTIKRRSHTTFVSDARLDISGSKTFAITFSDDQAFDFKQSLYVNLSGELAKGVSISAQLSDSQSKLSPEGDSKELSSLDRVFIKVYGKNYELAMGDLELEYKNSRYMEYYSKYEGVSAWYKSSPKASSSKYYAQAAFSAGSGKTASLTLAIIDGKQGPYYLRPNDYQPGFLVVAGSEEIYVDGNMWERGLDYSIDYAEGSVMFKRLISSANSVLARFQYSEEFYPVSSYLNSSAIQLSQYLSLNHHFIWQQDDEKNPLLYEFSAADRDSLYLAGDNTAWGEGVFTVEAGTGDYKLRTSDTGITYYEYAPGDSLSSYNLVFSYVGYQQGDYNEFSPGKFRYTGAGLGSWLPQKRLIAPAQKGNLELALQFEKEAFKAGINALGANNDLNTLSSKDDNDNYSGIVFAYAEMPFWRNTIRADYEQRTAKTLLFGKYRNPNTEYDFSTLEQADSLAQQESNLQLSRRTENWQTALLIRYKDIYELYQQQALRFNVNFVGKGITPTANVRSTVSQQDYHKLDSLDGTLQYHQGDLSWVWKSFRVRMEALYNLLESENTGSEFRKYSPLISFGKPTSIFTQLSYTNDNTRIKNNTQWLQVNSGQTYSIKQALNSSTQRMDLEWTHRELQQPNSTTNVNSSYDLINLRSNHSFLKQAISLYTNYNLNQTEFFAKIRELQFVGTGLGLYDSTGVSIANGDFDYVFITSPTGTLSTETNAIITLYLKPGNYVQTDFFKRWQLDSTLNLSEQSAKHSSWKRYIFLPGEVFSETNTIYGRQNLQQTLWLELIRNHITANMQLNIDRNLDKRYQSAERSSSFSRVLQLDIKGYNAFNTRLQANLDNQTDTRYLSQTETLGFSALVQRLLAPQTSIQSEFLALKESGGRQDGSENYTLSSLGLLPSVKSVWMQRYRFSITAGITRNFLKGSSYYSFLPQKRDGWVPSVSLNGIYRMNNFSSLSLDYRFSDYPAQKSNHELKLEFKAEL